VITACANCRIVMEEALEHYAMPVVIEGVTELIAAHLKPSATAPADD
jgi:hypothetical protein